MLRYLVLFTVMATLSARETPKISVDFATNLYQKTVEDREGENVLISPLALRIALGVVLMGAEGKIVDELVTGQLLETTDKLVTADKIKLLLDVHNNIRDIKIATKILAKQNCRFKNEFVDIVLNKFQCETENVNFGDINNVVQTINNWVLTKTHEEIVELIKETDLDHDTEILLANAVSFHGSWKKTFDTRFTRQRPFNTIRSGPINTEMMSMSSKVLSKTSDELNCDIIRLPYTTEGLYMLVMLPKEQDGLRNLEKKLNRINLLELSESMADRVDYDEITLPKFHIDYKLKWKKVLEKMDMGTMYTDRGDLSKMVESSERIKISKIISKVQMEVTEEGLEPGTTQELRNVRGQGKKFIADHPFFYAVMNEHGILVAGRIVNPMEI